MRLALDIAILVVVASTLVGGPLLISSWTERQARSERPILIREEIIRLSNPYYKGFAETVGVRSFNKLARRSLKPPLIYAGHSRG